MSNCIPEVFLDKTGRISGSKRGKEKKIRQDELSHRVLAPAWSCKEPRSINYASEFVPRGGKGAGLSYLHTVNHWLRAPQGMSVPQHFQHSACFVKVLPIAQRQAGGWIKSQVWAVRSVQSLGRGAQRNSKRDLRGQAHCTRQSIDSVRFTDFHYTASKALPHYCSTITLLSNH